MIGIILSGIVGLILMLFICRENTPYYGSDPVQMTYQVKHIRLADLLIQRYTKECGQMRYDDYCKMSLWGALSYLLYIIGFFPYLITWILSMTDKKYEVYFYLIAAIMVCFILLFGFIAICLRRVGAKRGQL